MTPADEIEYVIREIATHDDNDAINSYSMKSFPEIHFLKCKYYYMIRIMEVYSKNGDVINRFEKVANELRNREISIENRVVDKNRSIALHGGILMALVPIYYKECIFTYPHTLIGTNCKNCIIEKR